MSEEVNPPGTKKTKTVKEKRSLKERRLMKALMNPENGKGQAGIIAGYSPPSASAIVSKKLADPDFKRELQEMMDKAGLSKEAIIRKVAEGAEATKKQHLVIDGEIKTVEDTDFEQRGKYLDRARKIRGDMGDASGEEAKGGTAAIFIALEVAVRDRGLLP